MKKKIVKCLYEYVNKHYQGEKVELCKFIGDNIDPIANAINLTADDYEIVLDSCTDNTSEIYLSEFVPLFSKFCDGKDNRILLSEFEGSFYLCLNEYAKNYDSNLVDHYYELLQKLCKSEIHDSSIKYEQFCKLWFQVFCKAVSTTPTSNDKGVDLVGVLADSTIIDQISPNKEIHMLAQIKLFDKPIDTPIIRKFLGDVLFLTFDEGGISIFAPTVLFVVGHNGFTNAAKAFGCKHNVILLDSRDLIRIISCLGDLKSFDCICYLDSLAL